MRPKCWDQKCIYAFDILWHLASETSAPKKKKKQQQRRRQQQKQLLLLSANMCVCVGVINERPA